LVLVGNLIALSDENRHVTANSFDLFGETVQKVLPDGTLTETRNYDTAGNLTSLTHFNGVTTTYTYDSLNRLLSRATPGEATVSFTYTPTGKYLTSTAGDGTVNYTYDSLDRLITKATPEGTLSYTYDLAGHVASIQSSNSNGANVSYTYDDLDRLETVVDHRLTGNNTTTYSYDSASNVATAAYPNGLQSSFTYDALNRLTAMNAGTASYSYQLGPTGNRTQASESNGRTINWTYDGIYRLTNESITSDPHSVDGSVAYGLDPVGNRLTESSSIAGVNSGSYGYNADDEVSTETYDSNGNTLSAGGKSFTYDAENHLTGMSVSGTTVSVVYDAFGNRVAKTVNGVTTKYLVEDDVNPTGYPQVLDELTGSTVTRTYTYGLQRISQDQLVSGVWTPSFYGYDGGGNVRQLTNSAGAVTDTYEYDAFGNDVYHTGTTPNNYLYRGEQYDPDLGLYYLRARYYNPATGRFLSRDPDDHSLATPNELHKYLYADGDPENMIDPTGKGFAETLATYGVPIKKAVFLVAVGAAVVACIDMVYEVIHEVIDQMDGKYLPGEFFWNYGKTVAKCLIPLTGAIALAD
jgi:RHS repeat-associated protein